MEKITKEQSIFYHISELQKRDSSQLNAKFKELLKLQVKDLTPSNIDRILGHNFVTRLECYECGNDSPMLVKFNSVDYEGSQSICEKCLDKALSCLRGY